MPVRLLLIYLADLLYYKQDKKLRIEPAKNLCFDKAWDFPIKRLFLID